MFCFLTFIKGVNAVKAKEQLGKHAKRVQKGYPNIKKIFTVLVVKTMRQEVQNDLLPSSVIIIRRNGGNCEFLDDASTE